MRRSSLWLALAVAGLVVPYVAFVPWVAQHGIDPRLFIEEMFANRIAAFFALDVLVSSATVIALIVVEGKRLGRQQWIPIVGLSTVGVSFALPLVLLLREREREQSSGR